MSVLRTTVWTTVCSGTKALPRCTAGSFRPKTTSARDSSAQIICFLYGGFSGQTAFSGNNFDFGTSIEDKRTVTEYHNQTNVIHSRYTLNDCEGKLKGMPGSTTT